MDVFVCLRARTIPYHHARKIESVITFDPLVGFKQGSKFDQMGRAYKQVSIQYNCTKFYSFILLISCDNTDYRGRPLARPNKCQLGISVSMMLHRSVTQSPIPHPKWNSILLQTHLTNRPTVDRRLGEPINDWLTFSLNVPLTPPIQNSWYTIFIRAWS